MSQPPANVAAKGFQIAQKGHQNAKEHVGLRGEWLHRCCRVSHSIRTIHSAVPIPHRIKQTPARSGSMFLVAKETA